MKTISKLFTLMIVLTLSSCLVDDDVTSDTFDQGPNIVGFINTAIPASVSADGNTSVIDVPVTITGPTSIYMTEDITVTVSVDAASTAIADTHYSYNTTTVTLTEANDYTATVPVTILTAGINPPLDVSPILKLAVTDVTGNNLVISGRTGETDITINYLCYSDLEGLYFNPTIGDDCNVDDEVTVELVSPGRYLVSSMSSYTFGAGGCIHFYMIDVCGILTYDGGGLEDNGYSGEGGTGYTLADGTGFNFTNVLIEASYEQETTFTRID